MTKPGPSARKRLLFAAASSVAAVLALELGWRGWLALRGRPHDAGAARAELARLHALARDHVPRPGVDLPENPIESELAARVLHPFTGWEHVGGLGQLEAELAALEASDPRDLEVLIVGGSVAEIFGTLGVERLRARLEADPALEGRRVRFLPHGRGGWKQPQQLALVGWLLGQGFDPEVVLAIDGFNEVTLGNDNARRGTSPIYPSIPHWGTLAAGGVADRAAIDLAREGREAQEAMRRLAKRAQTARADASAVATTLCLGRLRADHARMNAAYDAYAAALGALTARHVLAGPPFEPRADDAVRRSVRMWVESSRSLRAACEARGIVYLHALQPTLLDEGSKPASERELAAAAAIDSWKQGVAIGYPLLRAAGAGLAAGGERFVDLSGAFAGVEEPLYHDPCHFDARGNEILADRIADALLPALRAAR